MMKLEIDIQLIQESIGSLGKDLIDLYYLHNLDLIGVVHLLYRPIIQKKCYLDPIIFFNHMIEVTVGK